MLILVNICSVPCGVPFRLVDNLRGAVYYRYSSFLQPGNTFRCCRYELNVSKIVRSVHYATTVFVAEEFISLCPDVDPFIPELF